MISVNATAYSGNSVSYPLNTLAFGLINYTTAAGQGLLSPQSQYL